MNISPSFSVISRSYLVLIGCMFASPLWASPSSAEESSQQGQKPFTLVQGKGLPVCDAYLEELNQTPLDRSPFCGRPDNGPAPHFISLTRENMGAEDIYSLFTYVWEFMRFDDQHHVEKYFHPQIDRSKSFSSANPTDIDTVEQSLRFGWMHVWSYSSPIDIANDGHPLRVLIWQGYGATNTGSPCGNNDFNKLTDSYIEQRAFILSADGTMIDEPRTRAIFGALAKGPGQAHIVSRAHVSFSLPPGATPFEPLAESIGIFGYDGKYYIQTENMPSSRNAKLPPVEVYLRQAGRTKKVCAYRPDMVPIPGKDVSTIDMPNFSKLKINRH